VGFSFIYNRGILVERSTRILNYVHRGKIFSPKK